MHQRYKAPGSHTCHRMKQNALELTKQTGHRMKQNASVRPGWNVGAILPNVSWNKMHTIQNVAWNKMREQSKMWHEIKFVDTKGKEKLGRHNNDNNKGNKKAFNFFSFKHSNQLQEGPPQQKRLLKFYSTYGRQIIAKETPFLTTSDLRGMNHSWSWTDTDGTLEAQNKLPCPPANKGSSAVKGTNLKEENTPRGVPFAIYQTLSDCKQTRLVILKTNPT